MPIIGCVHLMWKELHSVLNQPVLERVLNEVRSHHCKVSASIGFAPSSLPCLSRNAWSLFLVYMEGGFWVVAGEEQDWELWAVSNAHGRRTEAVDCCFLSFPISDCWEGARKKAVMEAFLGYLYPEQVLSLSHFPEDFGALFISWIPSHLSLKFSNFSCS